MVVVVGGVEVVESHPFVPREMNLEGYVPLVLSQSTILCVYALSSLLIVSLTWFFSGQSRLAKVDRVLMCWWMFTGLTHMILEGYFVFSPEFYKDKSAFYLAEVWKEYSKGDSRYAARDSLIVSVEGVTAVVEGPLCILAVFVIATKKSYSYVLQLSVSLGQLYGTVIYFITSYLEGDNFAASRWHYYAYYVLANSFWVVIPLAIVVRCWKKICTACQVHDSKGKAKVR